MAYAGWCICWSDCETRAYQTLKQGIWPMRGSVCCFPLTCLTPVDWPIFIDTMLIPLFNVLLLPDSMRFSKLSLFQRRFLLVRLRYNHCLRLVIAWRFLAKFQIRVESFSVDDELLFCLDIEADFRWRFPHRGWTQCLGHSYHSWTMYCFTISLHYPIASLHFSSRYVLIEIWQLYSF